MKDEQLKIDLKPCPFCGKSVMALTDVKDIVECSNFECEDVCPAYGPSGSCGLYIVVCNVNDGGCGASTGYHVNKTEAMRAWNRRAE